MSHASLSAADSSTEGQGAHPMATSPEQSTNPSNRARRATSPITVHFPPEVRKQLKQLAVDTDRTMHQLVAKALNDFFEKRKLPRIAPEERPSRKTP